MNDNQKHHFELESKEIQSVTTSAIKIKDCKIQHMIVFFPDGSIHVKQNICSCNSCIRDELIDCSFEPGVQINSREINSSDDESDGGDYDYNDENISEVELKEQRLRGDCVLEMLQPDTYIAIFPTPSSSELFYLCKVLEFGISLTVQNDKYNHTMPVGASFMQCQYLERLEEKKRKVFYKLLPDVVFVFPAEAMSPLVPLKKISLYQVVNINGFVT